MKEKIGQINQNARALLLGQRPLVIWFTGLSGAGKSTIASELDRSLQAKGFKSYLLDGDVFRNGLSKDLAFDEGSRFENIRRAAEVARLMLDAGLIVLAAFITPKEKMRKLVTEIVGSDMYFEVFVNCPVEVCESRDPKGLYKKARIGQIEQFTGVSSDFEVPGNSDITLQTDRQSVDECVVLLLNHLIPRITL